MTKFTNGSYKKSLEYANKGIRVALKSQRNFRFQICFAFLVILAAIYLNFSRIELCITIFVSAAVLVAELFNSVIEFTLDAVFKNKRNTLVGMAKDMSAGAVLLTTFAAVIIGLVLFIPHIYDIIVLGYYWF